MKRFALVLIIISILSFIVSAVEQGSFTLSIGAPVSMQKYIGEDAGEYDTDFYLNDSAFTFADGSISGPGYWKEPQGDIAIFFNTASRIVDEGDLAVTEGGYIGKSTSAFDKQFWEQRDTDLFGNIDICKERKDYPAQATLGKVKDGKVYCVKWGAGLKESYAMIRINNTEIKEDGNFIWYDVNLDYIYSAYVAPPPIVEEELDIIEEVVEEITDETEDIMEDMEENMTEDDMMVDAFEDPETEQYEEEFIEPVMQQSSFLEENKMVLIGVGIVVVLIIAALLLFMMKKKHEGSQPPQQPGQPEQPQQPPQQPQQQPQEQYQQPEQPQPPQEPEMKQPGVHM